MLHPRATLRRLLLEQLTERIAFHAGEVEPDSALMLTPDGHAYYYDPPLDPAVVQSLIVSQTENQRLVTQRRCLSCQPRSISARPMTSSM